MSNVASEISLWAASLPFWEQVALNRILSGTQLNEQDFREFLTYLLEDAGLVEKSIPRPQLVWTDSVINFSGNASKHKLVAIHDLNGINALVPGQRLEFGANLTAIYGANGSGKSGYARVLGSAAFTRGDRQVLPNVTKPNATDSEQCATLIFRDGQNDCSVHYRIGEGCPELVGYYMFDSTAVHAHMNESNAISFSPAGLNALQTLAEVTDKVRVLLTSEINKRSVPPRFADWFVGESQTKETLRGLSATTDEKAIETLAQLSTSEAQRLAAIGREIAELRLTDPTKKVNELKQTKNDLSKLSIRLKSIEAIFSQERLSEFTATLNDEDYWYAMSQQIGVDSFRSQYFTQTGTDPWYEFIRAARALAQAESGNDTPYPPQSGGRCLFCHQPLSGGAIGLIQRLWQFLENEAQTNLVNAQNRLATFRQEYSSAPLEFFTADTVGYRWLRDHSPNTHKTIEHYLTRCQQAQEYLIAMSMSSMQLVESIEIPPSGCTAIQQLVESLDQQIAELELADSHLVIANLEAEARELQHRQTLGQNLDKVKSYVADQRWCQKAEKAGGNTRHITKKHNELFGRLITDRYIQLFEELLTSLGRPMQVRIKTLGRKGQAYKQIVVQADEAFPSKLSVPDKVLSEGEKRVVALADFLTEVALDENSCGVILDDPVTSLDLEWRSLIASVLVREAQRQQVIVFTHDLPFLHFLKEESSRQEVDIQTHWIKRGDVDDHPGYVFVKNSPALEKDYKTSKVAQDIYTKSRNAPPQEQERLLRDGFGALRTSYEAFTVFELFNEVVLRFGERISFGRLSAIVWDREIADDVVKSCERLSRYIEGHLHSDALLSTKPTPSLLLEEIKHFDAIRDRYKALKKK